MTAVLDKPEASAGAADGPEDAGPASWCARAGAFGFDVLIGLGVVSAVVLLAMAADQQAWLWWTCVASTALIMLILAVNRWLVPALTGASLGRALLGIAVVERDGGPVGPWRLMGRDVAHLSDTVVLCAGWLLPLWEPRRRTLADLLARTEVHRTSVEPKRARRYAMYAVFVAAGVAVAVATLGHVAVYRHHFNSDQAREQLAVQGPKIVTDVLSYQAATVQGDFDRAQSLVTDGYRPQLVAQQRAVQDTKPVDNEYWVANASVLSNTVDHGDMLVLLQGQRGVPPNQRTITATVRVAFEKAGDQWKLANLTVLTEPQPAGGAK